ncbi:MAG: hypothetical protein AAFN06_18290 [Pseudomonadota bacterium]
MRWNCLTRDIRYRHYRQAVCKPKSHDPAASRPHTVSAKCLLECGGIDGKQRRSPAADHLARNVREFGSNAYLGIWTYQDVPSDQV